MSHNYLLTEMKITNLFNSYLLLVAVLALNACVSVIPIVPTEDVNQAWKDRASYLNEHESWTAHMSLIGVTEQQKFKTRVVWEQQSDQYQIKLRDFIGRTIAVIDGSATGVVAKTSKGKRYQGSDAEALINELFGIRIPVTGMRYWLQGLPQPNNKVEQLTLTDDGLAENIHQQGWHITYPNYLDNVPYKMPSDVLLAFDELELTVNVSQWTFSP